LFFNSRTLLNKKKTFSLEKESYGLFSMEINLDTFGGIEKDFGEGKGWKAFF
jgi:hypothetical protein